MKRIVLGLMGIVLLCCASSQANILVSFNLDGNGNASVWETGLAATPFTAAIGPVNWITHSNNGQAIGATGFKTSGNYFTFTLTVGDGYILNITDLHVDNAKENKLNSQHWDAWYKIGNGALTAAGLNGNVAETWDSEIKTMPVLGNLQNTNVTFRIAPTSASDNTKHWYVDNVTLSGTITATPEPATVAILALGGQALLRKRK